MSGPDFATRRSKLIRSLKPAGVDGLLVTGQSNVRYLTGFTGDSSWLLISRDGTILISDSRYETQIKNECPGLDANIRSPQTTMNDATAAVIGKAGVKNAGFEAAHLSFAQHAALQKELTSRELVPTTALVEDLRVIKDKWEIKETRLAIYQAERAIAIARASLRPNQTETEIRFAIEASMREFGAVGPAFEPIVGVGPTGALPHAHAGRLSVAESPALLIDWGAETRSGYHSDLTRVFFTGRPTKKMRTVYETVLQAQQAAIQAIRPGIACRDVDAVARGVISDAGFGKKFGHGTGHGIGLDIHEAVRLAPTSDDVLQAGMIVTVEPGIYLEGHFGVRIEDDVLVTPDGYDVLTSVPREFDDAVVEFLA